MHEDPSEVEASFTERIRLRLFSDIAVRFIHALR